MSMLGLVNMCAPRSFEIAGPGRPGLAPKGLREPSACLHHLVRRRIGVDDADRHAAAPAAAPTIRSGAS